MEKELQNEVDNVKSNHPGYDEYILNNTEYIGHNVMSFYPTLHQGAER